MNEMRGFVGDRKLRKVGMINNENYIVERVEEMTAKGSIVKKGYSPNKRERAEQLLRRYRKAKQGKKNVTTRNANKKLSEHLQKRRNNNSYRTNTFRRLERKLNNGNNTNVISDALKAKEAGNLTNQEYVELRNHMKNLKNEKAGMNITNAKPSNNNNNTGDSDSDESSAAMNVATPSVDNVNHNLRAEDAIDDLDYNAEHSTAKLMLRTLLQNTLLIPTK